MSGLPPHFIARMAVRLAVIIAALAAVLFGAAGRLDWTDAWAFVGAYGGYLVVYALWSAVKDPAQLQERGRSAADVKPWDRVILAIYTGLVIALFVVAGLDAGRFGWSSVSRTWRAVGWAGLALAGALIFWTVAANTYLSRGVRIQRDRCHQVVSSGPYRFVRHPMYVGIIVMWLTAPLALGSWWAEIVGACIAAVFVVRTALEDRTLQAELDGYRDYAERVRYRLAPGIW